MHIRLKFSCKNQEYHTSARLLCDCWYACNSVFQNSFQICHKHKNTIQIEWNLYSNRNPDRIEAGLSALVQAHCADGKTAFLTLRSIGWFSLAMVFQIFSDRLYLKAKTIWSSCFLSVRFVFWVPWCNQFLIFSSGRDDDFASSYFVAA